MAQRSGGIDLPRDLPAFLASLSPEHQRIVIALRDVIVHAVPAVEVSIVWGALSFHRPDIGGRVKGGVCMIEVKEGAVRLEFIHGVRLPDPDHVLQGTAKSKRFVVVRSPRDAASPRIASLVIEAAEVVKGFS